MIVAVSILCVAVYLRIYHQGGSFQAEWHWMSQRQI